MHFAWTFPLLGLFGLVIPIARAEDHQVTVGGIGILKYDPEFLVRVFVVPFATSSPDLTLRMPTRETL